MLGTVKAAALTGSLFVCAALGAGTSTAEGARPNACTTKQAFAKFGDQANYALLVGGNIEKDGAPWDPSGTPTVVGENEKHYLDGSGHKRSLELKVGDVARFHAGCLPRLNPSIRFVARSVGSTSGTLKVTLQYKDLEDQVHTLHLDTLSASDFLEWAPTRVLSFLNSDAALSESVSGNIRLILTPEGTGSVWRVDNLFIDPYRVRG